MHSTCKGESYVTNHSRCSSEWCVAKMQSESDHRQGDQRGSKLGPYGLKWLLVDKASLWRLYRAFCQLDVTYCAEHYLKMLISSEDLKVSNPPLAGSDEHFSLVDGKYQKSSVAHSIASRCVRSRIHSVLFDGTMGDTIHPDEF